MFRQKADKIKKVKGFGANQEKQQLHSFIKPQPPRQNKTPNIAMQFVTDWVINML